MMQRMAMLYRAYQVRFYAGFYYRAENSEPSVCK